MNTSHFSRETDSTTKAEIESRYPVRVFAIGKWFAAVFDEPNMYGDRTTIKAFSMDELEYRVGVADAIRRMN